MKWPARPCPTARWIELESMWRHPPSGDARDQERMRLPASGSSTSSLVPRRGGDTNGHGFLKTPESVWHQG
jgi:hypothetical protein